MPLSSEFTPSSTGSRLGTGLRVLVAVAGAIVVSAALLWFSKVIIADKLTERGLRVLPLSGAPPEATNTLKVRTEECAAMETLVKTRIQESRECVLDADCATISLGCPFGCATAIRSTFYVDIGSLNDAFQSRCGYCLDGCTSEPAPSVCRRGLCTLNFRPTLPPGT